MTEISKEWCINMAKQEEGDIGAGKLAIDPTADNFQNLPLNESFERVAKVAKERDAFNEQMEANKRAALRDSWNTCLGADVSNWAHDHVTDMLNTIDQQAAEIASLRDYICRSPSDATP